MGMVEFGHGDNRVPKLDYMLWHKHISFVTAQTPSDYESGLYY